LEDVVSHRSHFLVQPTLTQLPVATAILALGSLAACSAPTVDAAGHFGQYELDGHVAIDDSALGLTSSNSMDDLGLGDDDTAMGAYVRLKFGGPMLYISAIQPEFAGTGTLSAEFSDGGITIPVGTVVNSRLAMDVYTGMFIWDLFPTDFADVGLGFGVSVIDYDSSFENDGNGDTIASDETLPVPVLGAMVSKDFGPFQASGFLAYTSLDIDGDTLDYLDLDLRGTYHLFGGAPLTDNRGAGHLVLGYKLTDLELEYQDGTEFGSANLEISGPYLGLRFSF
tara:strand:- start:528 stop:1373 length:846 start_codon:yes stop_codon:yes gene_type:complete